jgi:lysozyme family protein
MKSTYELVTDVLRREGWPAVTDDPADAGGLSRGGVSLKHYNRWRLQQGLPDVPRDKFHLLAEFEARQFFEASLFEPLRFVKDARIFAFVADWSVNAGPDNPIRAIQKELQKRGFYAGAVDGIAGPKTRAAWNAATADLARVTDIEIALIKAAVEEDINRAIDKKARAFIEANPDTQLTWLKGWVLRRLSFL